MAKILDIKCIILLKSISPDITDEQIDKIFGKEVHERKSGDLIDKYIKEDNFDKSEYMPFGINGTLRRDIRRNEEGQITTICMHGVLDRPVYEVTEVYNWFYKLSELSFTSTGSLTMIMDEYFTTTATF